jgi:hypothetical protein
MTWSELIDSLKHMPEKYLEDKVIFQADGNDWEVDALNLLEDFVEEGILTDPQTHMSNHDGADCYVLTP